MDVTSMIRRLRHRLEDPSDRTWSFDDKMDALKDAEGLVLALVRPEFVKNQLGTTATKTLTGSVPNATLPDDLFRDALTSITYSAFANYAFKLIDRDESAKYTNRYLAPTNKKAIGFIDNNVFYSLVPGDTGASVKMNYIRNPKTLVLANPGDEEVDTSELPTSLHIVVCFLAEAICWRADDEPERASLVQKAADIVLSELKQRTTANEIKTDERPNK